jgi:hypothetical protein
MLPVLHGLWFLLIYIIPSLLEISHFLLYKNFTGVAYFQLERSPVFSRGVRCMTIQRGNTNGSK